MQRCFQLDCIALTTLLIKAAQPNSPLSCIAASHLDLSSWPLSSSSPRHHHPRHLSSSPSFFGATGCRLKMLALHNSVKLTTQGLYTIVSACTALEVLALGGSTLALAADENDKENDDEQSKEEFESNSTLRQPPNSLISRLEHAASTCNVPPCCADSSQGAWLRKTAVQLAASAFRLPHLKILELTFCGPGLVNLVAEILHAVEEGVVVAQRLHVWDMCSATSIKAAVQWKQQSHGGAPSIQFPRLISSPPPLKRQQDDQCTYKHPASDDEETENSNNKNNFNNFEVETMVSTMARCSSPGRSTPLHSAAEEGNVVAIGHLLFLGAEVDARDRGGASPLFVACEAGLAAAAARLLAAGACVSLKNAAGEAPLYIAALRGHASVVDVLLRHCSTFGIQWQDVRLYGDGWTPLHAAAVSCRASIVAQLLTAAGPDAAALVAATNRYGSTCVHVAARKGTPGVVQTLVEAGGVHLLTGVDYDGRTAADVARRNGNTAVWRVLTGNNGFVLNGKNNGCSARSRHHHQQQQQQRATAPTVVNPRQMAAAQQGGAQWVGRRLQQRKAQGSS